MECLRRRVKQPQGSARNSSYRASPFLASSPNAHLVGNCVENAADLLSTLRCRARGTLGASGPRHYATTAFTLARSEGHDILDRRRRVGGDHLALHEVFPVLELVLGARFQDR